MEVDGKDKTKQAFRSVRGNLDQMAKRAAVVTGALSGMTLAAVAVRGALAPLNESVKRLDDLGKAARRANVAVETLQASRLAAELGGIASSQIDKAFVKLQVTAGEAAKGLKTYKDSFDALGVSVLDTNGRLKDSEILWRETIDALAKLESGTQQTNVAYQILGRVGGGIAQVFKDQGKSIDALIDEYRQLGLIVDDVLVQNAEQTKDQFTVLGKAIDVFTDTAMSPLVDSLGNVAEGLSKVIGEMTQWLRLNTDASQSVNSFTAALEARIAAIREAEGSTTLVQSTRRRRRAGQGSGGGPVTNPNQAELQRLELQRELLKLSEAELKVVIEKGKVERETREGRRTVTIYNEQAKAAQRVLAIKIMDRALQKQINETEVVDLRTELDKRVSAYEQLVEQRKVAKRQLDAIKDTDSVRYTIALQIVQQMDAQIAAMLKLKAVASEVAKETAKIQVSSGVVSRINAQALPGSRGAAAARNEGAVDSYLRGVGAIGSSGVDERNRLQKFFQGLGEDTQAGIMQFGNAVRNNLTQALLSGDFDNVGNALITSLQAAFLDAIVGTAFSQLFKYLGIGTRASGGRVQSGRAYLVGERGPEPFIPDTAGQIVSNAAFKRSMGAPNLTIINNSTFNGNVRSDRDLEVLAQSIKAGTEAAIVDKMRRGKIAA